MAAELKQTPGIDAELVRGGGGIFDIAVDGEVVFSKRTVGRFPRPGEAATAIAGTTPNA